MKRLAVIVFLLSSGLVAQFNGFQVVHQPPDANVQAVGRSELTQQRIIALARADAWRYHKELAWGAGGGLLGVGAMVIGGIFGLLVSESSIGLLIGVGVGAYTVPAKLSSFPVYVPESSALNDATQDQREIYQQAFTAESRRLRRNTVIIGELALGALAGGALIYYLFPIILFG